MTLLRTGRLRHVSNQALMVDKHRIARLDLRETGSQTFCGEGDRHGWQADASHAGT
jgi:hypothetical protein